MNPQHDDAAPDIVEDRTPLTQEQPTPTVPANTDTGRRHKTRRLAWTGCPAGCRTGHHQCGVGEPITALPEPGERERAGRDLDWPQRERIGREWLQQRHVA